MQPVTPTDDRDIEIAPAFHCACCGEPWPHEGQCRHCGGAERVQSAPLTEEDRHYAAVQESMDRPWQSETQAYPTVPWFELESVLKTLLELRNQNERELQHCTDTFRSWYAGKRDAYHMAAVEVARVLMRYEH